MYVPKRHLSPAKSGSTSGTLVPLLSSINYSTPFSNQSSNTPPSPKLSNMEQITLAMNQAWYPITKTPKETLTICDTDDKREPEQISKLVESKARIDNKGKLKREEEKKLEHQLTLHNTHIPARLLTTPSPAFFPLPQNPDHKIGYEAVDPSNSYIPHICTSQASCKALQGCHSSFQTSPQHSKTPRAVQIPYNSFPSTATGKIPTYHIIPYDAAMPSELEMKTMLSVYVNIETPAPTTSGSGSTATGTVSWVPGLWAEENGSPILIFGGLVERKKFGDGMGWRYWMSGGVKEGEDRIRWREDKWIGVEVEGCVDRDEKFRDGEGGGMEQDHTGFW